MKKILVIDDEALNLKLMSDLLESNNYQVITISDPLQCINSVIKENPDLVLMDIKMPVMDGYELIKILRDTKGIENTKVIALTAFAMKENKEEILDSGFDGYQSKPIHLKNLLEYIRSFLE